RARALEIARLPEDIEPTKLAKSPARKTKLPANMPSMAAIAAAQSVSLPLYGRIAAGLPIEALRDPGSRIDVPVSVIANPRKIDEHYALEVDGDSMIEEGIKDGDHVVIRKCSTADNGNIVVALIGDDDDGGNEVTLKKFERRGNKI